MNTNVKEERWKLCFKILKMSQSSIPFSVPLKFIPIFLPVRREGISGIHTTRSPNVGDSRKNGGFTGEISTRHCAIAEEQSKEE